MKATISQGFFLKGQRQGIPCVKVVASEKAKDRTVNEIIQEVMEYRGKVTYVAVATNLKETPEAIELIRTLSQTNFKVVVHSDTTDDVSFFASSRSINFSLEFVPPNAENSNLNHASVNAMREGDELVIATEDKTFLSYAINVVKEKVIIRPDVVFVIPEELSSLVMKNKFPCVVRIITL